MRKKNKTPFYYGILGGGLVITLFLTILISTNFFNYRIQIQKLYVNNSQINDSTEIISKDSLFKFNKELKLHLLEDLHKSKIILSPQEYTNNIVNYYNSLLLILSVMLAAFSFLGFVYIKSHSQDLIEETLHSDEFNENVAEMLVGKAENSFQDSISKLNYEIKSLENRLAELSEGKNLNEEIEE